MFLWDWFTGVLKGLGLMNKSGNLIFIKNRNFDALVFFQLASKSS